MHRIALAALAALCTSIASPAVGQSGCGNPADMEQALASKYSEAPTARGVDARGNLVTVYSNPETGTWTVVVFSPAAGCAAAVASGEGWHAVEYVAPNPGRPS